MLQRETKRAINRYLASGIRVDRATFVLFPLALGGLLCLVVWSNPFWLRLITSVALLGVALVRTEERPGIEQELDLERRSDRLKETLEGIAGNKEEAARFLEPGARGRGALAFSQVSRLLVLATFIGSILGTLLAWLGVAPMLGTLLGYQLALGCEVLGVLQRRQRQASILYLVLDDPYRQRFLKHYERLRGEVQREQIK